MVAARCHDRREEPRTCACMMPGSLDSVLAWPSAVLATSFTRWGMCRSGSRSPGAPQAHVPVDAVAEDRHPIGHPGRGVCASGGLPERVANGTRTVMRLQHITAGWGRAEYGSRAPATTSSNTALTRPAWSAGRRAAKRVDEQRLQLGPCALAPGARRRRRCPPGRTVARMSRAAPGCRRRAGPAARARGSPTPRRGARRAGGVQVRGEPQLGPSAPRTRAIGLVHHEDVATSMSPAFIVWIASPDSGQHDDRGVGDLH